MTRTRKIFFGLMGATGLLVALAGLVWPVLINGPVPWLVWLLMASLAFDLVSFNLGGKLQLEPLDMNTRFMGFLVAALIVLVLSNVLPGAGGAAR